MASVLRQAVMGCDTIGGKLESKQINNVCRICLAFHPVTPYLKQEGLRPLQWEGGVCTKRRTRHAAVSVKNLTVRIITIPRSRNCLCCHGNGLMCRATVFDEKVLIRATTILMSRVSVPLSEKGRFRPYKVLDKYFGVRD